MAAAAKDTVIEKRVCNNKSSQRNSREWMCIFKMTDRVVNAALHNTEESYTVMLLMKELCLCGSTEASFHMCECIIA